MESCNIIEQIELNTDMGVPLASNLQTLLVYIKSKLLADGVFTQPLCYLGLYPEHLDPETADIFCVITPGRQIAEQPQLTGEGNYLLFFNGEIQVTLWGRLCLDAGDRGDSYLTDGLYGILPKLEQTYVSLNMFQPQVAGNQLIAEPFRIISIDKFERVTGVPGWGRIITTWDLSWWATGFNLP